MAPDPKRVAGSRVSRKGLESALLAEVFPGTGREVGRYLRQSLLQFRKQ